MFWITWVIDCLYMCMGMDYRQDIRMLVVDRWSCKVVTISSSALYLFLLLSNLLVLLVLFLAMFQRPNTTIDLNDFPALGTTTSNGRPATSLPPQSSMLPNNRFANYPPTDHSLLGNVDFGASSPYRGLGNRGISMDDFPALQRSPAPLTPSSSDIKSGGASVDPWDYGNFSSKTHFHISLLLWSLMCVFLLKIPTMALERAILGWVIIQQRLDSVCVYRMHDY